MLIDKKEATRFQGKLLTMSNLCNDCKASGLPILPVRYCPVPVALTPSLPSWAGGQRVTNVSLGGEFHYALRTLRAGYVYLFYSKNQFGSNKWECYMVTVDGLLVKQPDPLMAAASPSATMSCTRQGHSHSRLHHLVIERPDKCGTTWIAFSEHKWSAETLQEYATNEKLRDARMQTLHPAKMADGGKHSHGTPASVAALEQVLEYAPTSPNVHLPHNEAVSTFSNEDGSVDASRLGKVSTRYPWALRKGQADADVKALQARAKKPDGTQNTAHILALWDAIGTVHELNGFRNDAAGWVHLYGDERSLQLDAANTLDGLCEALKMRAGSVQKAHQDQILQNASNWNTSADSVARRANAQKLPEPQRSRRLEICDILDDWARRQVPMLGYGSRLQHADLLAEPRRSKEIAQVKADVEAFLKRRSENYSENIKRAEKHAETESWPKYEARIDRPALDLFKRNTKTLSDKVDTLIDRRTEAVVAWLESPLLVDTLEDFHPKNIRDGVLFEDKVSSAIFGIGTSARGAKKLKEWVAQANAGVKSNLYWRAVALNQEVGISALNNALREAERHRDQQTLASAVAWTGYTAKTLKGLADTYKKAQGVFDAVEKAKSADGSKAFGVAIRPVNMRGADQFMIGAGDWAFRHFGFEKLGDYASEKIIQHIFSLRAHVDPQYSEFLIKEQAANDRLNREQTLRRLQTARTFMKLDPPDTGPAQSQALKDAWARFKASDDAKVPQALKDARLALVVAMIEGVNFSKLIADCKMKGDAKSYFSLLASGMSITSALFDVAATVAKNLPSKEAGALPRLGSDSWTYQALKGWGGLLSGTASFIGGVFDLIDGRKARASGYELLATLYRLKAAAGFSSAALTLAVTCTYSAHMVARLTGRAAAGTAVELFGARAAALVGFRILGMAVGGWITLGTLALQLVIWKITPDALEQWVDHTAFGKQRRKGGFKTAKEQEEKLGAALVELGLQ